MALFPFFRRKKQRVRERSLASLVNSRLRSSWILAASDPNAVGASAATARKMARDLEESNAYAISFLRDYRMNVVGPDGVKFQSRVVSSEGVSDPIARKAVETAFAKWKQDCCVSGDMTYSEAMAAIATAYARDGQVFIRHIEGADNPFRYAIQLIDADMLAERHSRAAAAGENRIIYGKEVDQWDRLKAVYFYTDHPDAAYRRENASKLIRVSSEELIDHYVRSRLGRFTGLSILRGAIEYLKQLKEYDGAELVAAKAGACAFASIEKDIGATDEEGTDFSATGKAMNIEPGTIWDSLPAGWKVKYHKAEHPNTNMETFRKAILRGACAATGVQYNTNGQDLEGVTYSSLREGRLTQNDIWRCEQAIHVRRVETPIFQRWLKMALLAGAIPNYTIENYEYLLPCIFQPRRWAWVDPLKDVTATVKQLNNKLTTVAQVLAERDGTDLDDFLAELMAEREKFAAAGMAHPADTDASGEAANPEV